MHEAVIFDIDGTLATTSEERHELILKRSWEKFHRLSICAQVNKRVADALHEYQESDKAIIIITGRPERWRETTEHWLERNDIYYDVLFMRKNGDRRKSSIAKKEHVVKLLKYFDIIAAWDDRQQDIDMFEEMGISTVKVEGEELCFGKI